eukprot:1591696-Amphidinium_carterae.1
MLMPSPKSMHTFAITNQPGRLAFVKRSDRSQKLCSIDRLLEPRKGQPDTFTSVSIVANPTTAKVRVASCDDQTQQSTQCAHRLATKAGS